MKGLIESFQDMIVDWNVVSSISAASAAVFAAYSSWQSHNQVKAAKDAAEISADAIQIQVFDNIFRDVQQKEKHFECSTDLNSEQQLFQDRMFFNTVNYLAFLVQTKILRKSEFLEYYRDAFIHWDKLFELRVSLEDRNNDRKYPEFKQMVAGLKNPTPSFSLLNK